MTVAREQQHVVCLCHDRLRLLLGLFRAGDGTASATNVVHLLVLLVVSVVFLLGLVLRW